MTRLIRAGADLPELLAATACAIADSLGFATVVIDLYRPAWDDFCVGFVHGGDESLVGRTRRLEDWEPLLDERFARRGAYVVDDSLFVPMTHSDGHLLGIVSAGGGAAGDEELDVLVALVEHAAIAVQAAQEAADAARHRRSLEELLKISSRLGAEQSIDELLQAVCTGIEHALGFQNVAVELLDPRTGELVPKAAVGWSLEDRADAAPVTLADVEPLLDPEFEVEGCYLLPHPEAERRLAPDRVVYVSGLNGSGRWAWNEHWLLLPLHDPEGAVIGMIWADEPDDRLLPSPERLQALRIFANQAAAAVVSAQQLHELRFLADHDPLTRLLNRRAFIGRLEQEIGRVERYGRPFALVLCDLDDFKELNDRYGHAAGDEALRSFAGVLEGALRKPDDAFRIGGDEFALILAEASQEDARAVVRRATELLAASGDGRLEHVSASFGSAACPADASDAQTLFRLADEALYEAKRSAGDIHVAA